MTGGETSRLEALERTLVAAAVRQAQRRRLRRRRAIALLVLAAPLMLAVGGSLAATRGFLPGVDQRFATLRDDRLIPPAPPSTALSNALGAAPRDWASRRAWFIDGQQVVGYTTPSGRFCYRFGSLTGGCIGAGTLTRANPVAYSTDYGPGTLHVYGMAIDDVAAVSLRVRGVTRPVLVARNAFYFSDDSLGSTRALSATLLVRMRGGATRRVPIHWQGGLRPGHKFLPLLPGTMPARDTAA